MERYERPAEPSDEHEAIMQIEASDCNNCLEWHKYCKAECCKIMKFNILSSRKPRIGKLFSLTLAKEINDDMKQYLEIHGGKVVGNTVTFRLVSFRWDPKNNQLFIFRTCDWLTDDLKCSRHPKEKPVICQDLDESSVGKKYYITPNCLFKYKKSKGEQ